MSPSGYPTECVVRTLHVRRFRWPDPGETRIEVELGGVRRSRCVPSRYSATCVGGRGMRAKLGAYQALLLGSVGLLTVATAPAYAQAFCPPGFTAQGGFCTNGVTGAVSSASP